jgi:hypothetical protein
MRCKACDKQLSDYESTRKSKITQEYYDLCNTCFSYVRDDVDSQDRLDLFTMQDEVDFDTSEGG